MINQIEKGILVNFFGDTLRKFELDAGNVILFQIKVSGRNIKKTTLARYFIKVIAHPSFTRLRIIWRINRDYRISNRKYATKIQLHFLLI